jgi:hypothetical protein
MTASTQLIILSTDNGLKEISGVFYAEQTKKDGQFGVALSIAAPEEPEQQAEFIPGAEIVAAHDELDDTGPAANFQDLLGNRSPAATPDFHVPGELTQDQREELIADLANWKNEAEEWTDWDIQSYIKELTLADDRELVAYWRDHVGEWVLSRGDLDRPLYVSPMEYLNYQFGLSVSGLDTDYGFVDPIRIHSYLNEIEAQ